MSNGTRRTIVWDEENRIQEVSDNGHTKTYKYDDAGERVIKRGPQGETAYVNQFYTIRNREVGTKHVFAGGTRLVSKLVKAPNVVDVDGDGLPDDIANGCSEPWGWTNGNGGQGNANGICNGNAGGNGNGNGGSGPEVFEKDQYYYHPDHLGSSSYVTDLDGEIFQHLEYFPFGETWVEEHSNTQRTPYLFTSKELDEETGLYYFGARYYDPRTSVWQSPDPILAEYLKGRGSGTGVYSPANLSLYNYVHQRPLVARDPDGKVVNWLAGAIGAAGGAVVGGGFELGRQLYMGEEVNLRRVGASAAVGAVAGGITGVTMGTNLLVAGGTAALGSAAGGTTTRAILGESTSVEDVVFDGLVGVATFGVVRGGGGVIRSLRGGLPANATFAQTTSREQYSRTGREVLSDIAGQPINTIDDLAAALRNGLDPSKVPVNVIRQDGQTLILNTRTVQALERAGVPRSQYNVIDQTGDELF